MLSSISLVCMTYIPSLVQIGSKIITKRRHGKLNITEFMAWFVFVACMREVRNSRKYFV